MKNENKVDGIDGKANWSRTGKARKYGLGALAVALGLGILALAGFNRQAPQDPALAAGIVRDETTTLEQVIGDHRLARHGYSYRHDGDARLVASRREGALTWFRIEKWNGNSSWLKKLYSKVAAATRECFSPDSNGAYVITHKGYVKNESLEDGRYVHVANVQVVCNDLYGTTCREYPVYVDERLSGTAKMSAFLDNAKVVAMLQEEMDRNSSAGSPYGRLLEQSGGWLCGVGPLARFKVDAL